MAAAASDKARFFLEQSVPELQAYKEKGIFTQAEIGAITAKRSQFEHRINMAGASAPADFARYASYEMNLDLLRKKRCKRLGVKGTHFAGQKRVFGVLERGTKKFQGDMGLWMQYLEFCQKEEAHAKLVKGLTKVLRLHPIKWELWVWAARYYFEAQGDISAARSYMQRGLRFCERERRMWVQYFKLELIYMAKVAARRKILKLDATQNPQGMLEEDTNMDNMDADEVALPAVTEEEMGIRPKSHSLALDDATIRRLSKSPALSGAIPVAIFEGALKTFGDDVKVFEDFEECIKEFDDDEWIKPILSRIGDVLRGLDEDEDPIAVSNREIAEAEAELGLTNSSSAEFPSVLGRFLAALKRAPTESLAQQTQINLDLIRLTLPRLLDEDMLDKSIVLVLTVTAQGAIRDLKASTADDAKLQKKFLDMLRVSLENAGVDEDLLVRFGIEQ